MQVIRLNDGISEEERNRTIMALRDRFAGVELLGHSSFLRITATVPSDAFRKLDNISEVVDDVPEYALGSRRLTPDDTAVVVGTVDGECIGGKRRPVVIAGPCSVENYDQMARVAERLVILGVRFMRAGAYKPRTSPYSFQGLKKAGLEIIARIKKEFGLLMVTEVMHGDKIDEVSEVADMLQVGSRNMFNYALLEQLGRQPKPVLLKRGMAAGMHEFLLSAEYLLSAGNGNVVLCERGIKTFEVATRNTLDLNVVPHVKQRSHLPIIVDPSHGTGVRSLVAPMSLAALACGADGLLIEVHDDPEHAMSDGEQSLTPDELGQLMQNIDVISRRVM